jgi:hypothetical protein
MVMKEKKNQKVKIRFIGIAVFVILAGIFAGCQETDEAEAMRDIAPGNGYLVIKLTDAPFPADLVAEANITIDRIQFLATTEDDDLTDDDLGEDIEDQGNNESSESKFVVEFEEPVTFNLLELSNGVTTILTENEIPAGYYNEIRLHIIESGIVLTDETRFDLKIPSGSSSGLKIKLHPSLHIEDNGFAEVLLDIDVSRSFIVRGNLQKGKVNGFIFKPVVRAIINAPTESGEIAGKVSDTAGAWLENALVTLKSGEEIITTALTNNEGFYAMIGIAPGEYTLVCEKETYEPLTATITVEAGKATEQNFVLTMDVEETEDNNEN